MDFGSKVVSKCSLRPAVRKGPVRKAGDRAPPSRRPQFLPVKKTRSDFATENIQMLVNLFVWDF